MQMRSRQGVLLLTEILHPGSRNIHVFLKPGPQNANEIRLVAPTGFEPVFSVRHALAVSN
jgi:hypothetical protein